MQHRRTGERFRFFRPPHLGTALTALVVGAVLMVCGRPAFAADSKNPPNIVFIFADDES